jgi:hypothetical protein
VLHGSKGTTVVVVVDVTDPSAARRLAAHDHWDAVRLEMFRKGVITVQREQNHAFDMATGKVAGRSAFLLWRLRDDED